MKRQERSSCAIIRRMTTLTRRDVLKSAVGAPLAAALPELKLGPARDGGLGPTPTHIRRAVLVSMLPESLGWKDRFALAKEAGFDGVEMQTMTDRAEADAVARASADTGLAIHSVMNMAHWDHPISSPDPEVVRRSVEGMKTSLTNAALWKAGVVLLVPAVVNATTSYADAWTRSQRVIRDQLLPVAAGFKVTIAVEEVWNKFLLSPLEFVRYVDEFKSQYLKAYFDVGNVVLYGYPQDWIRTLGSRIVRLHLKDFRIDRSAGRFDWKNIGEGDIDWQEVRRALTEIGFNGWATTEIEKGDHAYLTDVVKRVDRFLAGFKPVETAA
jgi:L-ribulose-5-phosphate 3-epimerase